MSPRHAMHSSKMRTRRLSRQPARRRLRLEPLEQRQLLSVSHLIHISVDGLCPDAITTLEPSEAPNFYRLRTEGAFTDNARTDYDYTTTLQNHANEITSRPVLGTYGHDLTINSDDGSTIHDRNGSYVTSAFDIVHDHGGRTGMYASKEKFSLLDRSWNATYGRVDQIGTDDGTDKIDNYVYNADTAQLTATFIADMESEPLNYAFVCWADPDSAGHASGWMSQGYLDSVKAMDGLLGNVFNLIDTNETFTTDNTAIVLTADHGGSGIDHSTNTVPDIYTVPFYVWGPNVLAGGELYAMNAATRQDPAGGRPDNDAVPQPIRNGDAGNLATQMLGYGAIEDSLFNVAHDLDTTTLDVELVTMVQQGSYWSFLDDGSDQGIAWRASGFDDTGWATGPAVLGFGDPHIVTPVEPGPADGRYTTTYFRHSFDVANPLLYSDLDLNILRDDGAVVYLNGQEVARSNMPEGEISYSTFSSSAVGGADETTFFPYTVDPARLVDGTNVLAVEIHQCNLTSSDLGFDLELKATELTEDDTTPPTAVIATPEDNGAGDLDPTPGAVTVGYGQAAFEVQLSDSGIRIDDITVSSTAVILKRNGSTLVEGVNYTFGYDMNNDLITLTGEEPFDTNTYQIILNGGAALIKDRAGNALAATTFDVVIDRDQADSFTLVLLPDTQHYTDSAANFPQFTAQTQWVADKVATENLAFVTHVGDVVQNGDDVPEEWSRADQAMDTLDGVLPYSVVPGNHDFDVVNSHSSDFAFTAAFGSWRYKVDNSYDWYLGAYPYNTTNHVQTFTAGGRQFLHIGLEWEPRQSAIDWAQALINTYSHLPVVLTTHSYLNGSGRSTGTSDGGYSGEAIFQTLVKPNPQVFMVLCGHVIDEYHQVSTNDAGLEVIEILADYQGRANGGDGWLQLLEFVPGQDRIDVTTYSPTLDQYETDADSQFSFTLDFDQRFSFAPTGSLMTPLDGGPDDLAPAIEDRVLTNQEQSSFQIRLTDIDNNIDWDSVTGMIGGDPFTSVVEVWKDSSALIEDTDFTFSKSWSGNDIIVTLTPTAPPFGDGLYNINLNPSNAKIKDLDGNELAFTKLTVEIDTSIVEPQTATFQQGQGGYTGTVDTNLFEDPARSGTSFATAASLNVDADEPSSSGNDAQALVRFDSVFGAAAGQVPTDAAITSATLELQMTNGGQSINLHRMLQSWADTYTWNSFAADGPAGIQAGSEAAATADVSTGSIAIGTLSLDVAAAITAWQGDPSSNHGWVLLPTGIDGVDFNSAEGATPPKLIVEYLTGGQNSPPVVLNDGYGVDEDNTLNVAAPGVLGNDTDADGDTLTASPLGNVSHGTLMLYSDGAFDYTPDPDFNGTDSFSYTADDGNGGTDTAVVTITVNAIPDPPVAGNDAAGTNEDTAVTVDVLANDSDADGDSLTVSSVTQATNGTVVNNGDDVTYTPDLNFNGVDSFTYTVDDDNSGTDTATVTITVNAVNDAPVLGAIGDKSVDEGSPLTFSATATDADLPANTLTFSLSGAPSGAGITSGGDFSWTPTEAQGPGDFTFDVVVSDGSLSDSETITVTVGEVNVAPVLATIGDQNVDEGVLLTFTATATDADLPANTLTFSLWGEPAGATIDANSGVFTWTPTEIQGPGVYTFDVVVSDGSLSDSETITVTVNEANIAPVLDAVGNQAVDEGSLLTFTATATDPDSPPDGLAFSLAGGAPAGASIDPGSGVFTWAPTEAQGPGSYPVTIQVTDDGTPPMMDSETITVTVNEINSAPVLAAIGDKNVDEAAELTFTATATDSDLPANVLAFSLLAGAPAGAGIDPVSGVFTWTPTEGQGPGSYPVTIQVDDDGTPSLSDSETITVTVGELNTAPVLAAIGDQSVDEGTELTFTATAADSDLPANVLAFSLGTGAPAGASIDPGTGVFTWTPSEAEGPGAYSITIQVDDDGTPSLSDSETITVTVGEVNTAPVANPDSITVDEGGTATVLNSLDDSVLDNDTDADLPSNPLTAILDSGPTYGTLTLNPDGTFSYGHEGSENSTDSFTYHVNDGTADGNSVTVSITVNSVNDAPVAADDSASTTEGISVDVDVLTNDTDDDGDTLSVASVTQGANGTVTNNGSDVTYTPDPGYSGTDTFDYTLSDGNGGSDTGTVTITVTPGELPFYAVGDSPGFGTVSGTFADTRVSDDARQTITEESYAGSRSRLEHIWDFGQVDGATKFVVEAYRSDLSVDDFLFEYSTDGVNWTAMIAGVTTTETVHEHVFAAPVSGTMQVRVTDTDRGKERTLDTVSIDEMYFLCETGPVLPTVTITATDAAAAEGGSDPGVFTVNRTGDLLGDLVVSYTIGGTADGTDDYETLSGSVTILDGDSSATITVTPIDDGSDEGDETVILTLASDAAYTVGLPDSDAVTIADNDGVTPVEIIVDDGDAGYTEVGDWKGKANELAYGGDYRYSAAGDGSMTATWTFDSLAAGDYQVFATWVAHPTKHASDAPYTVTGDRGSTTATVDVSQQVAPDGSVVAGWQLLVTCTVDINGTLSVQLSNHANGYVIADAVRVVPVSAGAGMSAQSSAAADPGALQLAAVDFILGQDDSDAAEEDPSDELALLLLLE